MDENSFMRSENGKLDLSACLCLGESGEIAFLADSAWRQKYAPVWIKDWSIALAMKHQHWSTALVRASEYQTYLPLADWYIYLIDNHHSSLITKL